METRSLKKIAIIVNSVILLLVFGHMLFFSYIDVPFLVAFSIPDACVYLLGFVLIYLDRLNIYVWLIYCWITIYSGVTTICIGNGFGFHLYYFSMIPIIFVTEYITFKLSNRRMKALPVSIAIALFYIICTGYVSHFGPVFERSLHTKTLYWTFNALVVFCFLISFSYYLISVSISSEEKLRKAAQTDRLTQLYNRHYMMERLEALSSEDGAFTLAIADIDNFKGINDTYGHNAGDEVLKAVSKQMKQICSDCEISRWGGEEFLMISKSPVNTMTATLERLRSDIELSPVRFNGTDIRITLTVGIAERKDGNDVDKWIQEADKKLYYGKEHGKNCVISEPVSV